MKTSTKAWLILATVLVFLGCALFAGVMTTLGWDFSQLSTAEYETNTYEIHEGFDSIFVNTDTADIVFAYATDGKCTVVCREEENAKHSVSVNNGILTVELADHRSVFDYVGLNFDTPRITVCLPKKEYTSLLIRASTGDAEVPGDFTFRDVDIALTTGDADYGASVSGSIQIKTDTGDIRVADISAAALDLSVTTGSVTASGVTCKGTVTVSVSTGSVKLSDLSCKSVASTGSTGGISLERVIATESITVRRGTGSIRLSGSDAAELFLETSTGNITGSLLSPKIFLARSDTGSVNVPNTATGGKCEVITDTGSIKLTVSESTA